jgi:hypothetical protein
MLSTHTPQQKWKQIQKYIKEQGTHVMLDFLQFYSVRVCNFLHFIHFNIFTTFKLRSTTEQMPALVIGTRSSQDQIQLSYLTQE